MVVTRSHNTHKYSTKINISDANNSSNDIEFHTAEENSEDSEEDSDDEAPEEESTNTAKNDIIAKQKESLKQQQEAKKLEKQKRRLRDIQFAKQQESKRERKQEQIEDELPELLPEDILNQVENAASVPVSKHLTSEDFERDEQLLRQKLKEERLKQIKKAKKLTLKRGPVSVKVQSFDINKKVVPVSESKILNSKNKWFKRKSLNKK